MNIKLKKRLSLEFLSYFLALLVVFEEYTRWLLVNNFLGLIYFFLTETYLFQKLKQQNVF